MHDRLADGPQYPEFEELAEEARTRERSHGGFVDPGDPYRIEAAIGRRDTDWATAVLGRSYQGIRDLRHWEVKLLLVADERDVCPPLPDRILAARRAEALRRAAADRAAAEHYALLESEWAALREALPTKVEVAHNFESHRHCESGYVQGGDHIVPQEAVHHGRLRRRQYQAFCATPSYAHNLSLSPRGEGDDRWPTCKKCIRIACRITGLMAFTMLDERPAGIRAVIPNQTFSGRPTPLNG